MFDFYVCLFVWVLWSCFWWFSGILVTGLHSRPSPGPAHTAWSPIRRTHLSTTHSALLPGVCLSPKEPAFRKPPSCFQRALGCGLRSKWKLGNPSSRRCMTRAAFSFARFITPAVPLTLVIKFRTKTQLNAPHPLRIYLGFINCQILHIDLKLGEIGGCWPFWVIGDSPNL